MTDIQSDPNAVGGH
uniref:Uncharacterized protein n=1 Tax=Anopheles arabiensis TaxID=7173 RepID=A0A182HZJ0_ANOAR